MIAAIITAIVVVEKNVTSEELGSMQYAKRSRTSAKAILTGKSGQDSPLRTQALWGDAGGGDEAEKILLVFFCSQRAG